MSTKDNYPRSHAEHGNEGLSPARGASLDPPARGAGAGIKRRVQRSGALVHAPTSKSRAPGRGDGSLREGQVPPWPGTALHVNNATGQSEIGAPRESVPR